MNNLRNTGAEENKARSPLCNCTQDYLITPNKPPQEYQSRETPIVLCYFITILKEQERTESSETFVMSF